jgi:hypothetical protein
VRPPDLAGIRARVLLIRGRYDRMVPFEVSIAILNHIADSRLVLLNNCGHWPPCWSSEGPFDASGHWQRVENNAADGALLNPSRVALCRHASGEDQHRFRVRRAHRPRQGKAA